MAYSQTTLAQFTSDIASALSDPLHVYWSAAEIQNTIRESLLLWGALTSNWVERGNFRTSTRQPFYDLAAQLPTLRARTYTYTQLAAEIQYHLLEPATGSAGTGMTEQFSISDILTKLLLARNDYSLKSGHPLSFTTSPLTTAPPGGIVDLPADIMLLQRIAWIPVSGFISAIDLTDTYEAQAANPLWSLSPARRPIGYSRVDQSPLRIQLLPPPFDTGVLHLTGVYSQSSTAATLSLPDECAHAVKYLALSNLLSTPDSGHDPLRARYALERYTQYLSLPARSVISVQVNGRPCALDTISSLDSLLPDWQSIYGAPTKSAVSFDLLALSKVPASTGYTISCDVVRSAPLPSLPSEYLQIGREDLPHLFDYCRHLLIFKLGGSEFISTLPLYDNFLSGAAKRNRLIEQKARYLTPLFDQPAKQEQQTPPT